MTGPGTTRRKVPVLLKRAAWLDDPKHQSALTTGAGILGGVAWPIPAAASIIAYNALLDARSRTQPAFNPAGESGTAMARHVGLDPSTVAYSPGAPGGSGYTPRSGLDATQAKLVPPERRHVVLLGPGAPPGAAAHELGHALVGQRLAGLVGERGSRGLTEGAYGLSRLANSAGLIGGALGSPHVAFGSTVAALPHLAQELAASHLGGRGLVRAGAGSGLLRQTRNYLSAFHGLPTYGMAAAIGPLAYGGNRLFRHMTGEWLDRRNRAQGRWPALVKKADLLSGVKLQPHQQRIFDLAKDKEPMRMLMYHGLGTGKSLTALSAAESRGEPYTAVAPASLRANMAKEQEKFTGLKVPSTLMSYSQLGAGKPTPDVGTVILDEVHHLRNPGTARGVAGQDLARRAKQLILLSGTPIVNEPGDLAPLVSMLTKKDISPQEFNRRYTTQKKVYPSLWRRLLGMPTGEETTVQHPEELKALLRGHVDYYAPDKPAVPTTREDVHVDMGVEQTRLYKAMWDQLPWYLRWKLRNDFPLSKAELSRTMAFMTGPRQVSLSTLPYRKDQDPLKAFDQSTKLRKAMEHMKTTLADPHGKALVFSNFVDAGLKPYSAALTREGVPHAIFHGGLSDVQRKRLVEDFNEGRTRVALLGPSGTEGLSFKGTRVVQQLDPYWGPVRGQQAEGRGIRFDSHTGLPPGLQNVRVQRFVSRLPLGFRDRLMAGIGFDRVSRSYGTDDYLRAMEARKGRLNQQFLDLLREVGGGGK